MYIAEACDEILRISKRLCLLGTADNSPLPVTFMCLLSEKLRKKHDRTIGVSENRLNTVDLETKLLINCERKEQISAEKFHGRW